MQTKPIVLLTDFGWSSYVGAMKGVILSHCPHVQIIDLTHDVAPQNVREGAWLLLVNYLYFPPEHLRSHRRPRSGYGAKSPGHQGKRILLPWSEQRPSLPSRRQGGHRGYGRTCGAAGGQPHLPRRAVLEVARLTKEG